VSLIDPSDLRGTPRTLNGGDAPVGVVAGGGSFWVLDNKTRSVHRVDAKTGRSTVIALGATPSGIRFDGTAGQEAAWVILQDPPTVVRIDAATNAIISRIRLDIGASAIVVHEPTKSVWVTKCGGTLGQGAIERLDPATNAVAKTIPDKFCPVAAVATEDAIWIFHPEEVWRIDPVSNKRVARFPTPESKGGPVGLQWSAVAANGTVWAVSASGLLRIDPSTNTFTDVVRIPGNAEGIAYGGGFLWIVTSVSQLIQASSTDGSIIATLQLPSFVTAVSYGYDRVVVTISKA
jgi:streptogramin lyase